MAVPKFRIWAEGDFYFCKFSYSPELVEFIRKIPKRRWFQDLRAWGIRQEHVLVVMDEAKRLGFTCEIGDNSRDNPPIVTPRSTEATILEFFALLPPTALKAAYKRAALELHPDHGGDLETMARLNELWQQIEEKFVAQESDKVST